ncbi:MAG: MBL fold metallo-hydrolase, partial [Aquiluna sp.]
CDVGQGDALLIRSDAVMLIDTGNDPKRLQECLSRAGVVEIDLLVLTHFDIDHVGAAHTIANLVTGSVLVTGFRDDRPVVDRILATYGPERLVTGYSGLAGQLGGLSWRILSPSQSAVEAEDSNDASLVVMVQLAGMAVLGLGDLGESGQLRLMRNNAGLLTELGRERLILKVAHHGSKDQSSELFSLLRPDVSLFSVGANTYGHPTSHALMLANASGSQILRTDRSGSIAIEYESGELKYSVAGKLSQ